MSADLSASGKAIPCEGINSPSPGGRELEGGGFHPQPHPSPLPSREREQGGNYEISRFIGDKEGGYVSLIMPTSTPCG